MNDQSDCLALLARWARRGALRELDCGFARFIAALDMATQPLALLAAALVSHQLGRGYVYLDLRAVQQDPAGYLALPPDAADELAAQLRGVRLADWQAALLACRCCADGSARDSGAPLVLAGSCLYLRRYWRHQAAVHARIVALAQPAPIAPPECIRPLLDTLFAPVPPGQPDWQKLACALVARSRLAVITGGPGTGKTSTVACLLALLLMLAADVQELPLIGLAAPTGKAAARLTQSLRVALDGLPWSVLPGGSALRQRLLTGIGSGAITLHRLLGARLYRRVSEPLPLDVLVVDEASMLDLALLDTLLAALPPHARLVLLGDKDQLASVEAGTVLGDLCRRAERGHYDAATCDWLAACTGTPLPEPLRDAAGWPLDQVVFMLRTSHRFGADSGIGRLAAAVHAGEAAAVHALLVAQLPDVCRLELLNTGDLSGDPALCALVLDEARPNPAYLLRQMRTARPASDASRAAWDGWAAQLLDDLARFQLLCALREGHWGVAALNAAIETLLRAVGALPMWLDGLWYAGRPVLVTRNDTRLGLMNGDIGLTLRIPARFDGVDGHGQPDPDAPLALRVAFPNDTGGVRWLSPARLPAVETVWAMTVHKAQGSEFEHTALLLPDRMAPVLTRELIYTSLTRARQRFTLLCPAGADAILEQALACRARCSGGPLCSETSI
jgi:exodeoxyribonuclease V alpha subunit